MSESQLHKIEFIPNPTINGQEDAFLSVSVDTQKTLQAWQQSVFAFEWLTPHGTVKAIDDLADTQRQKRMDVEQQIKNGQSLPKPVLGIGMLDNVEIGSGQAVFATIAAMNIKTIDVHIRKSSEKDFAAFIIK